VPRDFVFRYLSATHFIDVFKTYYGPLVKAYASLDDGKREALTDDLESLITRLNRADDGTMVVPGEYLEVVVVRK
ncbi:MAG TPA: SAM-dependent methyltransferase, partial [Bordetella sp.]